MNLLIVTVAVDGKDSEDSSSGPLALANTEDSSEATNDSLSVVINSEETSREHTTNGNGNDTTNDDNTNDHDSSLADGVPTNGGSVVTTDDNAVVGGRDDNAVVGGDDNAVVDQEDSTPRTRGGNCIISISHLCLFFPFSFYICSLLFLLYS
jgi:hypothetical protein